MTDNTIFNTLRHRIQNRFKQDSQVQLVLRRFRQNRLAMAGLLFSSLYILLAFIGPFIISKDPSAMDPIARFSPPSIAHPFGTDRYGRDIFARVVAGAQISLKVATLVVTFSTIVGVSLGLIAGFYRGWVDEVIMRGVDLLFAFPSILLALVLIAILGPGLNQAIVALSIAYTPVMVRVTRGSALSVREEEYIMAAISYGETGRNIMFREMLPNMLSAVVVQATITFAYAILSEAALSYLGLSAQPPTPTWGVIISTAQNSITIAPWASFFPGLAIMLTVLGLTFLGVGMRDALDPKTSSESNQMEGM
jgi:peptide/nickel transport system permease protein